IKLVVEQGTLGKSQGKVVIFTESLTTQDYLRTLLLDSGAATDRDITLFRGTNDSARAAQALDAWYESVGRKLSPESRPSPDVAMRLALVDEFRQRSRIFISTEAGAKGLNLQFCDTVVNYDLPWNPQRIEQRIGRCHRYGQQRDVTVINFLAADNETQRLTFEILSRKLDLFGIVLGASDEVLHRPGPNAPESLASTVGADFEAQLRRIYDRARTLGEVEGELRGLRDAMEAKRREFEVAQQRTEDVIQRRFDAKVKLAFKRIQDELPRELAEFDAHVERVVVGYLEASEIAYRIDRDPGGTVLTVEPSPRLPEGMRCLIGGPVAGSPLTPLHLGHPLVSAALAEARAAGSAREFVLQITAGSPETLPLRGRRGRVRVVRALYRGFEAIDRIVPVGLLDGDDAPLSTAVTSRLLEEPIVDVPAREERSGVTAAALDDALDEVLFDELGDVGKREQPRFEQTIEQIERFMSDRILLLVRQRDAAIARVARSETQRDAAVGFDARDRAEQALRKAQTEIEQLDGEITRLRAGDDDRYRQWRQHTQDRRYAKPEFHPIFDAEFEIV
ncbi:MAG: hypothetical protein H0T79_18685, partial [Deltaproteobacteria bacterium]|nr:hypothetical protein [Deltaproteobacteria bacterium]